MTQATAFGGLMKKTIVFCTLAIICTILWVNYMPRYVDHGTYVEDQWTGQQCVVWQDIFCMFDDGRTLTNIQGWSE